MQGQTPIFQGSRRIEDACKSHLALVETLSPSQCEHDLRAGLHLPSIRIVDFSERVKQVPGHSNIIFALGLSQASFPVPASCSSSFGGVFLESTPFFWAPNLGQPDLNLPDPPPPPVAIRRASETPAAARDKPRRARRARRGKRRREGLVMSWSDDWEGIGHVNCLSREEFVAGAPSSSAARRLGVLVKRDVAQSSGAGSLAGFSQFGSIYGAILVTTAKWVCFVCLFGVHSVFLYSQQQK